MQPAVYTLTFPDGSQYVGCSTNHQERRRTHFRHMRNGRHENRRVQAAYDAHGAPAFDLVASGFDRASLHEVEASVIEALRPALNIAPATPVPPPDAQPSKAFGPHPSVAEAARDLGVTYQRLKKLVLRTGLSYESVVSLLAYEKSPRLPYVDPQKILVDGVLDYPKHHCACRGISMTQYRRRRRRGTDPFNPGTTMAQPPRMITAGGKTMTLAAWAKASGVKGVTICSRLDRHGWTPEEALGLVKRVSPERGPASNRNLYDLDGKKVPLAELAELAGLASTTVYHRLWSGWTVRQAAGLDPRS